MRSFPIRIGDKAKLKIEDTPRESDWYAECNIVISKEYDSQA